MESIRVAASIAISKRRKLLGFRAAMIKKLGAEHRRMPEGAVARTKGSSSSASSNNSSTSSSHPNSSQPLNTVAQSGSYYSPSTCRPPSIRSSSTTHYSSIPTSMTPDSEGIGWALCMKIQARMQPFTLQTPGGFFHYQDFD